METLATVKTDQNISIVQNAYADFAKGNITGILDACTDDIVWASYDNPAIPYAQSYQGKEGVGEFFAALADSIDITNFQPREFFADGDHVFVKGYHEARVKSTGKTFGHDFLMEFQLRNEKISSYFAYVDSREQAAAFTN
jgi:ketosteroid isomerase-like protein